MDYDPTLKGSRKRLKEFAQTERQLNNETAQLKRQQNG